MKTIVEMKALMSSNIRKYRKKLRMTQEQAAKRAGICVNFWRRIELVSQPDFPSLNTFVKIAKVLHVKPYRLLEE